MQNKHTLFSFDMYLSLQKRFFIHYHFINFSFMVVCHCLYVFLSDKSNNLDTSYYIISLFTVNCYTLFIYVPLSLHLGSLSVPSLVNFSWNHFCHHSYCLPYLYLWSFDNPYLQKIPIRIIMY